MNLTDFIKLGLDNNDNKLIKINHYLNSSKESFIQFIEDFPIDEQYQNAKKEIISSFYSSNPIENQKDGEIIQTQAGKYTNQNIYGIIGRNLELKNITQILKIPNESHYFIHGYRAALNRSGEKQENIDKIGEKILKACFIM